MNGISNFSPSAGLFGYTGYGGVFNTITPAGQNKNLPVSSDKDYADKQTGMFNKGNMTEAERKRRFDSLECETCDRRRYQDVSNDSGVSFQTPTKISPEAAGSAVRTHENQHVSRNQAKAEREDMKIVSQSVRIMYDICPECGKIVASGGETRTVTKSDNKQSKYNVGKQDKTPGKSFNTAA